VVPALGGWVRGGASRDSPGRGVSRRAKSAEAKTRSRMGVRIRFMRVGTCVAPLYYQALDKLFTVNTRIQKRLSCRPSRPAKQLNRVRHSSDSETTEPYRACTRCSRGEPSPGTKPGLRPQPPVMGKTRPAHVRCDHPTAGRAGREASQGQIPPSPPSPTPARSTSKMSFSLRMTLTTPSELLVYRTIY